jgi:purine-cytosine permease-like protein
MAAGIAVGTVAVLPTAIIGPRTGTNMTVSSGAFFGTRGRFIGSGLARVLTVNMTLYVGPLAEIAGGVDLSTIGSALLAGLIYLASLSFIEA